MCCSQLRRRRHSRAKFAGGGIGVSRAGMIQISGIKCLKNFPKTGDRTNDVGNRSLVECVWNGGSWNCSQMVVERHDDEYMNTVPLGLVYLIHICFYGQVP